MRTIARGAKGLAVLFLQRMLNKRGGTRRLSEDADYGNKTRRAVIAFKRANGIRPLNSRVDAATWMRFGGITEREHIVPLLGQRPGGCWSAAAAMVSRGCTDITGTRLVQGKLDMQLENIETFLDKHGWSLLSTQSAPPAHTLVSALTRGPVWVALGNAAMKHAAVLSGVLSDGTEDGTVFRVHDPYPYGCGTIYSTHYLNRHLTLRSVRPAKQGTIMYAAAP